MAQPSSFLRGAIFLGLAWLMALPVYGDNRPSILKVDRQVAFGNAQSSSPNLVKNRLPKFLPAGPSSRREVYEVYWEAPVSGLEPGVELRFDYLQERSKQGKALHIRYPFRVMGERKAVFEVSEQALKNAGPVVAWQVSLVREKQLLAQKRAGRWEK